MALVLDTETTIFKKGNPFAKRNKLCYVGTYQPGRDVSVGDATVFPSQRPALDDSTLLVGFHIKFDLHWLRRSFGWTVGKNQRVWCCQLAHFLLTAQRSVLPSLEDVRTHYGIVRASVKTSADYWARGIDTPDIPRDIILNDLTNDLLDTHAVYQKQLAAFSGNARLYNLFRLHCDDLVVLESMEWNGLNFNEKESLKRADNVRWEIGEIERLLRVGREGIPINFDSPEHVSCLLYGGIIKETRKTMSGFFKTGERAGQPKYRNEEIEHVVPRLCEPLDGTGLKKEGLYSTDESILRQLKGAAKERELLLKRSKFSKELDYLSGLPALRQEMDWDENTLHTSFNQCIAATGRLSSSGPNVQNLTDTTLQLIESKHDR